ncbi:MAG: response regulator [Spirochaetales bacterium]|nr:response regulator [Spirochaetales bacterium]
MPEPYKIILVDDEDEVRGRISSKISEESGFTVVGTAGNGYDALELIEKLSPQVVLTDIKMPYIDGIELAEIIRREYPTVRIGFITGYDEFDYARQAIKLNVRSYLTKPLTREDISSFLQQLKVELDEEYRDNYNREQIQKRYEQSLPLIIENYLVSFLASGGAGRRDDIEQLRQCGVSLDDTRYLVAFAILERNPEHWGVIEFEQLKLSVRARLGAALRLGEFDYYDFPFHEGIVFVIKEKGHDFDRQVDVVLNRMVTTTEHFLSVQVDIGISDMHKDFRQLSSAYEEASKALSYSRFSAVSRVSYFREAGERSSRLASLRESDAVSLEHALRYGTEDDVRELLDALKLEASRDFGHAANLNLYVVNLVSLLANHAASLGIDINELAETDVIELMGRIRNLEQLFAWVQSIAGSIRKRSLASKLSNSKRMLELAVNAIKREYADPDLTMDLVCDKLGISASYLGQLFKKYKESTFVKFLTGVRMEKAKELLTTTGDRIVEIALSCGYRDVYYFSHSFKKYTGVSPKKYREDND